MKNNLWVWVETVSITLNYFYNNSQVRCNCDKPVMLLITKNNETVWHFKIQSTVGFQIIVQNLMKFDMLVDNDNEKI